MQLVKRRVKSSGKKIKENQGETDLLNKREGLGGFGMSVDSRVIRAVRDEKSEPFNYVVSSVINDSVVLQQKQLEREKCLNE